MPKNDSIKDNGRIHNECAPTTERCALCGCGSAGESMFFDLDLGPLCDNCSGASTPYGVEWTPPWPAYEDEAFA
jgi:hypothetical protein